MDLPFIRTGGLGQAMDHHLRRVDERPGEVARIGPLPLGVGRIGKGILPADVIPVIHMERQGDDVAALGQLAKQRIGRRAGRAPLRRIEFDDRRAPVAGQRTETYRPERPSAPETGETPSPPRAMKRVRCRMVLRYWKACSTANQMRVNVYRSPPGGRSPSGDPKFGQDAFSRRSTYWSMPPCR